MKDLASDRWRVAVRLERRERFRARRLRLKAACCPFSAFPAAEQAKAVEKDLRRLGVDP